MLRPEIEELVQVFEDTVFPFNKYSRRRADFKGSQLHLQGLIKAYTTNFQYKKIFSSRTAGRLAQLCSFDRCGYFREQCEGIRASPSSLLLTALHESNGHARPSQTLHSRPLMTMCTPLLKRKLPSLVHSVQCVSACIWRDDPAGKTGKHGGWHEPPWASMAGGMSRHGQAWRVA